VVAEGKHGYNTVRSKGALGNLQPVENADRIAAGKQRDGALRNTECFALRPVASRSLVRLKRRQDTPVAKWMNRCAPISSGHFSSI
jgi:hypothetical protein